ncbi:MAG: hydrogenase maturation nickel metallochaperone HypA/HybF [bacterium]
MHELSIANEILNIIKDELGDKLKLIKEIELSVGSISGVNSEALFSAIELIFENEGLKNVNIKINDEKAVFICKDCGRETEIELPLFICGVCGSQHGKTQGGRNVLIKAVEINNGEG